MNKIKTSFTLSVGCINLLKKISEQKGISMASVIELAVREKAAKEKIS